MDKYTRVLKKLKKYKRFAENEIDNKHIKYFNELENIARAEILKMTTIAGSGHLGGGLSVIDIYLLLWLCSNISIQNINKPDRDRIIISNGHTAAAMYVALGINGFFDLQEAVFTFRKDRSIFEGHPTIEVPGVEWTSGNLGQGLSVSCGFAIASKKLNYKNHIFVVMGDGEQQKGQIIEAMRFANKYSFGNLIAIVDHNNLQACGKIDEIMPFNIIQSYKNSNWEVYEINGHSYKELYKVLRYCYFNTKNPKVIVASTVMGKGVGFIENQYEYHGKTLPLEKYNEAISRLNLNPSIQKEYFLDENLLKKQIKTNDLKINYIRNKLKGETECIENKIKTGRPHIYPVGENIENRQAFGQALLELGTSNSLDDGDPPIMVLDCDLTYSVRTDKFAKAFPNCFIQGGITEHNIATIAGAISKSGILCFWADFGVFGIDEVYNQMRMNDINYTSLKLICTHIGVDVGKDGKTHHCIDYISLISNLFNFKVIIPADANQTDHVIRYIALHHGNFLVALNRSKLPIISKNMKPFFGKKYKFFHGKEDWIVNGRDGTIISYGSMLHRALEASHILLKEKNYRVGVLNISCPLALDKEKIEKAAETGIIMVYEDHNIKTGLGNILGTYLIQNNLTCKFRKMGISNYGITGDPDSQYDYQKLSVPFLIDNFLSMRE